MEDLHGLVLTRSVGDVIYIGDDVAVQVIRVMANRARLKIVAPKDMIIRRDDCKSIPRAAGEIT